MFSTRWRKVLRDMWLYLPRTLMVILAIAIGIFGVGFVLNAYSILTREIKTNFMATNPASATLWMDKVDADVVNTARNSPGIADAEASRRAIRGRVQIGPNEWEVLRLFVVNDFNSLRINKFWPESGSWPPGDRQILIERASRIEAAAGSTIVVKALGGTSHELPIAGTVFDPGQTPAWADGMSNGYITPDTLEWLGESPTYKGLNIVVSDSSLSRSQIRNVANRLSTALKQSGHAVTRIEVPIPGKRPNADQINSFLYQLEAFGLLCLVLSGFMTATLISALLSQQIRQIGIMKAMGASTRQVMGVYFGTVLILSLIALVIAIPLGIIGGRVFAISVAPPLNINITSNAIPLWAYIAQIALGILVPLLTATYPVYRGSRVTVSEAISDYGVSRANFGTSRFDNLLGRIRGLPRPLMLSLRNTFRRRARIFLTLVMLAAGGTTFIASWGAAASWNQTIDDAFANIHYDIDVRFAKPYAAGAIEKSIRTIPSVTGVEAWGYLMSAAFPKYADGTYGGPFAVLAPPASTTLINPPMIEGRWLRPDDTNAMVVDIGFTQKAKEQGTPVHVGDKLTLNLNGQDTAWHVVGIAGKIGSQSAAYTNYDYLAKITQTQGLAACARVVVRGHSQTLQKTVSKALEQRLAEDGFNVFVIQRLAFSRQVLKNHIIIMLVFLMPMSILVATVGALGLASTMSVNVMERTREIGIMRALGASTRTILQTVIMEGVLIGVLSWLLGIAGAMPVTTIIASNAGRIFLRVPLHIVIPLWAPILWLVIVIIIAIIASFLPAWSAARLTVREVLAYE